MDEKLYDLLIHRLDKQDDMLIRQNENLEVIKTQVFKTNGRVTKLEFWISALKWTCGVLWTLIPLAVLLLYHLQRLQSVADSHKAVRDVLNQYNIEYQSPK